MYSINILIEYVMYFFYHVTFHNYRSLPKMT